MTAMPMQPKSVRENAVNGLRGLMLLLIVTTHYVPSSFFSGNIARPAAAVMLAVTGYFFMSIVERDPAAFDGRLRDRVAAALRLFLNRHMRIWPVMIGVVLMYVLLGFLDPSPITTQIHGTWPLYVLYMGNVVKMIFEGAAFPAHFWLISAQEQFVTIALGACVIGGTRRLGLFLKIAIGVGVVGRVVGAMLWMPENPALATESPFAIADAVALGMLCRIAIAGGQSKTALRRRVMVGIILTTILWAAVPNTYAAYFALVPLITALIGCLFILTLADEVRVRRLNLGLLSSPSLVLLGQMSLSLFLLHPLVNTLINLGYARASGELMPWWMLAAIGPPLAILIAYAYFRLVEVPIRRYRSGSARGMPKGSPSANKLATASM
jgi:peptidoglycan/LPS O-acetylase OafA/YrhL